MKQVSGFRCEYCGCLYDNEADAAACESSHANPIGVCPKMAAVRHGAVSHGMGNKYPEIVEVTMDDGVKIEYRRQFEGGW